MSNIQNTPRRWTCHMPAHFGRDDMDLLFHHMVNKMMGPWEAMHEMLPFKRQAQGPYQLKPRLDLICGDKAYNLSVELPGVEPDKVKLDVVDDTLVVSGEKCCEKRDEQDERHVLERAYGSFRRALHLPEDADVEAISATHKNGVLEVTIPRKAAQAARNRSIEIARA